MTLYERTRQAMADGQIYGVTELAQKLGAPHRSVGRALSTLTQRGELVRLTRAAGGASSTYRKALPHEKQAPVEYSGPPRFTALPLTRTGDDPIEVHAVRTVPNSIFALGEMV